MGWLRTFVVAIVSAAVSVVATLFLVGKLPMLQAYVVGTPGTQNQSAGSTAAPPEQPEGSDGLPSLSASSRVNENGYTLSVTFLNKGDAPIRVTRIVINKRYGVQNCDSNVEDFALKDESGNLRLDGARMPIYRKGLDLTLRLGESVGHQTLLCGTLVVAEVFTDQGDVSFKF